MMWSVPREAWGEYENKGVVMPLDIDARAQAPGAPLGPPEPRPRPTPVLGHEGGSANGMPTPIDDEDR